MKCRTFARPIVVLSAGALQFVSAAAVGAVAQEKRSNSSALPLFCDAQNAGAIYVGRKFQCRTAIPDFTIHAN
jgi:hypothetical protein